MSFINDFIHDGETRLYHGIALISVTVINLIVNLLPMLCTCVPILKQKVKKCKSKKAIAKKIKRGNKYLNKQSPPQDLDVRYEKELEYNLKIKEFKNYTALSEKLKERIKKRYIDGVYSNKGLERALKNVCDAKDL